jgi:hypothetical protein
MAGATGSTIRRQTYLRPSTQSNASGKGPSSGSPSTVRKPGHCSEERSQSAHPQDLVPSVNKRDTGRAIITSLKQEGTTLPRGQAAP